jgi:hypothetical protein
VSVISGPNLGPSGGPPPQRSRAATVALVVVLAIVLFGAGVALAWFLRGETGGAAEPGGTPTPQCVSTTTIPGVGMPKPGTVSINVYNSTDRTGLAAATAATLAKRGFVVGTIANDPLGKHIAASAELRHGSKGTKNAQLLKFYIAGAKLVTDDRTDASVDVVLGEDFSKVRSPAAVEALLKKPVVTQTGPGCPSASPKVTKSAAAPSGTPSG